MRSAQGPKMSPSDREKPIGSGTSFPTEFFIVSLHPTPPDFLPTLESLWAAYLPYLKLHFLPGFSRAAAESRLSRGPKAALSPTVHLAFHPILSLFEIQATFQVLDSGVGTAVTQPAAPEPNPSLLCATLCFEPILPVNCSV